MFVLMQHIPNQSESDWMHEANPRPAGGRCAEPADFLVYLLEAVACFYWPQEAEMPSRF